MLTPFATMRGIKTVLTVASMLTPGMLAACSVFSIVKDGKVIVGNNNDNTLSSICCST